MSIVSGYKKFKKYILTSSGFQLVSHWTKANTLEFDDGKTAQAKLGAIDGISSSRESNSDKIAASTALVSELNSDLTSLNDAGAIQGMDAREDGVYITYTPVAGADTVTKKLGSNPMIVKNLYFSLTRNQHPDGGQIGAVGLGKDLRFTFDVSEYNSMVVGTVATTQTNTYDRSTVYYSLDGSNNISLTTNLVVDISANSTVTINPGPTAYGNLGAGAYGLVTISSIIFT